jgi:hypothetical protein
MTKTKCQLTLEPFYQCCCTCHSQVEVHKNDAEMTVIGYACLLPMDIDEELTSGVIFNKQKHSCGCECFCDKRVFEAQYKRFETWKIKS